MKAFRGALRFTRVLDFMRGDRFSARVFPGGTVGLTRLAAAMPPLPEPALTPERIRAIEKKVFASSTSTRTLGRLVDITEVIGPLPRSVQTDDQLERLQRRILSKLIQAPSGAGGLTIPVPAPNLWAKWQMGARLRKAAVLAVAFSMLLVSVAVGSQYAVPGDVAYPLKLQYESIRLALAEAGPDTASTYLWIAEARMKEITKIRAQVSPWLLIETLGRLDGATVAAYETLVRVQTVEVRNRHLLRMSEFLFKEGAFLNSLMESAPASAMPRLVESMALAAQLASSIEMLLNPGSVTSPTSAAEFVRKAAAMSGAKKARFAPQSPAAGQPKPPGGGDDPEPIKNCLVPSQITIEPLRSAICGSLQ